MTEKIDFYDRHDRLIKTQTNHDPINLDKEIWFHEKSLMSNHTFHGKDDSYVNYLAGFTYSDQILVRLLPVEKLDLTLEYAGEHISSDQSHQGYVIGSRYVRLGRDDIFALLRIGINDDLSLRYLHDQVLWNSSRFQRITMSYRAKPGLVLEASYEAFDGTDTSYFGRWRNNDRLITMLTWTL